MNYRKPKRIFEKSGAVVPETSYFVPLEGVVNTDNQDIKTMVDLGRYFSIFAPRQSGKTTYFEYFCRELERDSTYIAIFLNFEPYANIDGARFFDLIFRNISTQLEKRLSDVQCPQLGEVRERLASRQGSDSISFYELFVDLNRIIRFKKIVIFIDEFDGIPRTELGNFLTAIRGLYQKYSL